jgi:ribosomal protein S18 acetylase RimI-like enzyme
MVTANRPTDPGFSLRVADAADARLLTQLGARLFVQAFGAANDPADLAAHIAKTYSVERETELLSDPDRMAWIAEDAGRAAIGYAILRRGTISDGVVATRPAEVQRIYTDQSWHGRGLGDALMRACIEQARAWRCDVLWLGVWEENPRAIAFYEKNGFRKVGRHTFTVGRDVQHDYVMARSLA